MRVVHVASADLWGGAEAQIQALVVALARAGIDVSVITFNPGSQLRAQVAAAGVPVHELDESTSSTGGILWDVWRRLRILAPHIVHTHRFKENILGGVAARALGVRSVRTQHGAPELGELEHRLRRRVIAAVDAWVARHVQSCVVAVSRDLARQLGSSLPGAWVEQIANGVDLAEIRKSARDAIPLPKNSDRSARIGFVGRLVPVKRVDLFLRMALEIARASLRPVEFYVVGEGPLRQSLEALARELGIADRVWFTGFVENSRAAIVQLDALVLTSDHEGLPMVVLEALALGVPVVARNVGGIPEVLRLSDLGTLVEGDDVPRMVQAVLQRIAAGPRTQDKATYGDFPAAYSIDTTARQYMELYARILRGRDAGAAGS